MLGTSRVSLPSTHFFSFPSLLSLLLPPIFQCEGAMLGTSRASLPSTHFFSFPSLLSPLLPPIFHSEGAMLGTSWVSLPSLHFFLLLPPPFHSRLLMRHYLAVFKQRGIPFYPLLLILSLFLYPPSLYLMRRRDTVFQHIVLPFYTTFPLPSAPSHLV